MENNDNQNLASSLCKAGCGFFGGAQYDGMCSKCYKDFVKRKQASPADSTTTAQAGNVCCESVTLTSNSLPSVTHTTASVETAAPTVTTISNSDGSSGSRLPLGNDTPTPSSSGAEDCESGTDSPRKSSRRNRCSFCKKKVGLTGFECRCGGIYCSVHRYSDKHDCEFDYKELGADHIRKNNPLVVGSKVQKL